MKIIYNDENSALREFANLLNSADFRNFVKDNLSLISERDYGMRRVQTSLCKKVFNSFFKARGFEIGVKTEHANGIGNNNLNYVQDLNSGEYIGALHLNSDMFSSVYCYATDIHKKRVSNTYEISPHGISLERTATVDWKDYRFGKEEYALSVIEDAIKNNVLLEVPSGRVLVFKLFDNGEEGWAEVSKEEAAKDLVDQDAIDILLDAIHNPKRRLGDQIQSAAIRSSQSGSEKQPEKATEPQR